MSISPDHKALLLFNVHLGSYTLAWILATHTHTHGLLWYSFLKHIMQLLDYIWTCFLVSGKQHMFFCLDGSRSMSYRFVGALPLRCVSLFHTTYTPWHKPNPMANAQQRFEKGENARVCGLLKGRGSRHFWNNTRDAQCMHVYIYMYTGCFYLHLHLGKSTW